MPLLLVSAVVVGAAACAPQAPLSEPERRPNVVLLVVDTLRADYLGTYGFDGPVSAHVDALAAESVVYERCFAQAPWTKPSVASLFTSLYPQVHRLTNHEGLYWGDDTSGRSSGILSDEAVTLAEGMRVAGYATGAFVSNPWVSARYGMAQGFDRFDESPGVSWAKADRVIAAALAWIESLPEGRPFFAYLHFMDVHAPYDAPREDYDAVATSVSLGRERALDETEVPYNRWHNIEIRPEWATDAQRHRMRYWRARYASGVRAFDRRLGGLLDRLKRAGRFDDSWIVLTSDHGEELFEHGHWSHGQNLHEHQLHVPLIVRRPGGDQGGTRTDVLCELVDVMPTLLAGIGQPLPPTVQGRDLADADADASAAREATFATATQRTPALHSVRTNRFKLHHNRDNRASWLFDVQADPAEKRNTARGRPEVLSELWLLLDNHLRDTTADGVLDVESTVLPEETVEQLKALGYMN